MRIGIAIAIARELKHFLESDFEVDVIENNNNIEIYHCKINDNEIFAARTGCGKIDAAAITQYLISSCDCEIILNFGVTGALDRTLMVNDLFYVESAVNYDYDVSPIDPVKKNQYEEFDDIYIPLDKELIECAWGIKPDLKKAVCASGDAFIEDKKKKLYLNSLGCNICDMEIAAIARICYLNNVKCLSIKCISDTFDGNGGDFNTNVSNSAAKAFALMKEIILTL